MYRTKIDIPEETRSRLVELLNARLADAIDLGAQAKQAHWNVRGRQFFQLHELFDNVAEGVEDYVDLIAERVVQLGGVALGTVRVAARRSTLREYPLDISAGADHVEALSSAIASFGKLARNAIDASTELGDADTADVFTEVSRGLDKLLWMVEAHAESTS
jgi:starvation-inducible DNA-binding protein